LIFAVELPLARAAKGMGKKKRKKIPVFHNSSLQNLIFCVSPHTTLHLEANHLCFFLFLEGKKKKKKKKKNLKKI